MNKHLLVSFGWNIFNKEVKQVLFVYDFFINTFNNYFKIKKLRQIFKNTENINLTRKFVFEFRSKKIETKKLKLLVL